MEGSSWLEIIDGPKATGQGQIPCKASGYGRKVQACGCITSPAAHLRPGGYHRSMDTRQAITRTRIPLGSPGYSYSAEFKPFPVIVAVG